MSIRSLPSCAIMRRGRAHCIRAGVRGIARLHLAADPAWGALVAIGALIGSSGINFWPVWIAAALGAAMGDCCPTGSGSSSNIRCSTSGRCRASDLIPRGEAFMRNGCARHFIGRFFGPLRASVPLIAGIFEMPFWRFQLANFTSAFVWRAVLLTLGDGISTW